MKYNNVVPRDVVPMGTITARKHKDGSVGYTAQILRKKDGRIIFKEVKTFGRKREAETWVRFCETEIDKPGALERLNADHFTLADAIDRCGKEKGTMGATKEQVLRTMKAFKIATTDCADIRSYDIVTIANELARVVSRRRLADTAGVDVAFTRAYRFLEI